MVLAGVARRVGFLESGARDDALEVAAHGLLNSAIGHKWGPDCKSKRKLSLPRDLIELGVMVRYTPRKP